MDYFSCFSSPLGNLLLRSDGHSLTGLQIGAPPVPETPLSLWVPVHRWLSDYFSGREPGALPCPLSPAGTPFQQQVWQKLLEIPYGQTATYGSLARQLSPGMSAQAVGHAVGRNPIAILIPCHRVIGARGQLTGYAWGLEAKRFLLELEKNP